MTDLPCKNPNCKSYGTPHPNCRCYGEMAEGGMSSHFCDSQKPHEKECQYFAEGTPDETVSPIPLDDIPDQYKPQETSIEVKPLSTDDIPDEHKVEATEQPLALDDIPVDKLPGEQKYGTLPQKIGAFVEGAGQGYAGPLATLAEKGLSKLGVPELSDEDIKAREEANPGIHALGEAAGLGAGLVSGTGELALVGRVASGAAKLAKIENAVSTAGKLGSGAIKAAITSGLFQAGDNLTENLLNTQDPSEPVGALQAMGLGKIGTAGILGGIIGGVGGLAGQKLEKLANTSAGTRLKTWLSGAGEAAANISGPESLARAAHPASYDNGAKWWNKKIMSLSAGTLLGAGATGLAAFEDIKHGFENNDLPGGLEEAAKDALKGAAITFGAKQISKPAAAVLLKALSSGETDPQNIFKLLDYGNYANSGMQKLTKGVENLFNIGTQKTATTYSHDKIRSLLEDWVERGGIDDDVQQEIYNQNSPDQVPNFAKGGEVVKAPKDSPSQGILHDHPVATVYPEQNVMLQTMKGRIYNYLNSVRPQQKNSPRLAFDSAPDEASQKKIYRKALDMAIDPLSILTEIKKGTLQANHVKDFNAMYPELNGVLQKKLSHQISDSQLRGHKPPYAVRQGLSLLMGTPLSSELKPQNIQAAQAVFKMMPPNPVPGQATTPKKNTAKLTKSNQAFLTGNQSLVSRQQKI